MIKSIYFWCMRVKTKEKKAKNWEKARTVTLSWTPQTLSWWGWGWTSVCLLLAYVQEDPGMPGGWPSCQMVYGPLPCGPYGLEMQLYLYYMWRFFYIKNFLHSNCIKVKDLKRVRTIKAFFKLKKHTTFVYLESDLCLYI